MPGKGSRFTAKEDRQAKHIADSERAEGKDSETAERIGYATVNANKSGSKSSSGKSGKK